MSSNNSVNTTRKRKDPGNGLLAKLCMIIMFVGLTGFILYHVMRIAWLFILIIGIVWMVSDSKQTNNR